MTIPVPVLLIGLGGIGFRYDAGTVSDDTVQTHARAFSSHPRFALVAGVDPQETARRAFTSGTGLPAYADIDAAIDRLDRGSRPLVVVSTPTSTHAMVVHEVLAKIQPVAVLCEKPLAGTAADGKAIVEACAAAGVPLFVNYIRRSLPSVVEVARLLREGRIQARGKVVAWYTKGLLHNGSHLWNLLEYWFGPVLEAFPLEPARVGPSGMEFDCRLLFADADATLLCGWEDQFSLFEVDLVAPNGRLRLLGDGAMEWQSRAAMPGMPGYHRLEAGRELFASEIDRYQFYVAEQLARYLANEAAELCTGQAAQRTLESVTAVLEAAKAAK